MTLRDTMGKITFEVEYRSSKHLPWQRFDFVVSKRGRPEGLGAMTLELKRLANEFPTCVFRLLRIEEVATANAETVRRIDYALYLLRQRQGLTGDDAPLSARTSAAVRASLSAYFGIDDAAATEAYLSAVEEFAPHRRYLCTVRLFND